jgi:hypothetical protein
VSHKERIKDIKRNVDVLTLSATPIPRTLQMSLSNAHGGVSGGGAENEPQNSGSAQDETGGSKNTNSAQPHQGGSGIQGSQDMQQKGGGANEPKKQE